MNQVRFVDEGKDRTEEVYQEEKEETQLMKQIHHLPHDKRSPSPFLFFQQENPFETTNNHPNNNSDEPEPTLAKKVKRNTSPPSVFNHDHISQDPF